MPMPAAERGKEVLAVVRDDGKRLRPENAWVVKKAAEEPGEWDELFGLFDCDGNNYDYQVEFIAPEKRNQPPLFEPIGQWAVNPSELIEFLVIATDEAGPPSLFSTQLPDGVSFDVQSRSRYASLGLFRWRPTADQVGVYPLKFFASDGELYGSATGELIVGDATPVLVNDGPPEWWIKKNVLDPNAKETNDYAVVVAGQLKHIARMAWEEMEETLPGGASFELDLPDTNNYVGVNIGQLKTIAKPYYDRMSLTVPWNGTMTNKDYAIANIGQVKHLFNFNPTADSDRDGMPDWWEDKYELNKSDPLDALDDDDGDGIINFDEYLNGTDPLVKD
jgi:hypothetical protein